MRNLDNDPILRQSYYKFITDGSNCILRLFLLLKSIHESYIKWIGFYFPQETQPIVVAAFHMKIRQALK